MRCPASKEANSQFLIALLILGFCAPAVAPAETLETVHNEEQGFTVDMPGTPWMTISGEDGVSSIRSLGEIVISVGRFYYPDRTLQQVKDMVSEQSAGEDIDWSMEDIEHPAGPGFRWVGRKEGGDKLELSRSWFIEVNGEVFYISCSSTATTDPQRLEELDSLYEDVTASFRVP